MEIYGVKNNGRTKKFTIVFRYFVMLKFEFGEGFYSHRRLFGG
jgi:hypothetical protein